MSDSEKSVQLESPSELSDGQLYQGVTTFLRPEVFCQFIVKPGEIPKPVELYLANRIKSERFWDELFRRGYKHIELPTERLHKHIEHIKSYQFAVGGYMQLAIYEKLYYALASDYRGFGDIIKVYKKKGLYFNYYGNDIKYITGSADGTSSPDNNLYKLLVFIREFIAHYSEVNPSYLHGVEDAEKWIRQPSGYRNLIHNLVYYFAYLPNSSIAYLFKKAITEAYENLSLEEEESFSNRKPILQIDTELFRESALGPQAFEIINLVDQDEVLDNLQCVLKTPLEVLLEADAILLEKCGVSLMKPGTQSGSLYELLENLDVSDSLKINAIRSLYLVGSGKCITVVFPSPIRETSQEINVSQVPTNNGQRSETFSPTVQNLSFYWLKNEIAKDLLEFLQGDHLNNIIVSFLNYLCDLYPGDSDQIMESYEEVLDVSGGFFIESEIQDINMSSEYLGLLETLVLYVLNNDDIKSKIQEDPQGYDLTFLRELKKEFLVSQRLRERKNVVKLANQELSIINIIKTGISKIKEQNALHTCHNSAILFSLDNVLRNPKFTEALKNRVRSVETQVELKEIGLLNIIPNAEKQLNELKKLLPVFADIMLLQDYIERGLEGLPEFQDNPEEAMAAISSLYEFFFGQVLSIQEEFVAFQKSFEKRTDLPVAKMILSKFQNQLRIPQKMYLAYMVQPENLETKKYAENLIDALRDSVNAYTYYLSHLLIVLQSEVYTIKEEYLLSSLVLSEINMYTIQSNISREDMEAGTHTILPKLKQNVSPYIEDELLTDPFKYINEFTYEEFFALTSNILSEALNPSNVNLAKAIQNIYKIYKLGTYLYDSHGTYLDDDLPIGEKDETMFTIDVAITSILFEHSLKHVIRCGVGQKLQGFEGDSLSSERDAVHYKATLSDINNVLASTGHIADGEIIGVIKRYYGRRFAFNERVFSDDGTKTMIELIRQKFFGEYSEIHGIFKSIILDPKSVDDVMEDFDQATKSRFHRFALVIFKQLVTHFDVQIQCNVAEQPLLDQLPNAERVVFQVDKIRTIKDIAEELEQKVTAASDYAERTRVVDIALRELNNIKELLLEQVSDYQNGLLRVITNTINHISRLKKVDSKDEFEAVYEYVFADISEYINVLHRVIANSQNDLLDQISYVQNTLAMYEQYNILSALVSPKMNKGDIEETPLPETWRNQKWEVVKKIQSLEKLSGSPVSLDTMNGIMTVTTVSDIPRGANSTSTSAAYARQYMKGSGGRSGKGIGFNKTEASYILSKKTDALVMLRKRKIESYLYAHVLGFSEWHNSRSVAFECISFTTSTPKGGTAKRTERKFNNYNTEVQVGRAINDLNLRLNTNIHYQDIIEKINNGTIKGPNDLDKVSQMFWRVQLLDELYRQIYPATGIDADTARQVGLSIRLPLLDTRVRTLSEICENREDYLRLDYSNINTFKLVSKEVILQYAELFTDIKNLLLFRGLSYNRFDLEQKQKVSDLLYEQCEYVICTYYEKRIGTSIAVDANDEYKQRLKSILNSLAALTLTEDTTLDDSVESMLQGLLFNGGVGYHSYVIVEAMAVVLYSNYMTSGAVPF